MVIIPYFAPARTANPREAGFSQRGFCDMIGAQPQRAKPARQAAEGRLFF
ncbi:hypothetical protein HMPREF0262_01913 [Clostridium sp. ATCC 29733]|nr:hypothetical protein HMPREF0262_01913 [Clostridium sp. ATCC 29733]